MHTLSSRSNPVVARYRALVRHPERAPAELLLDGAHLVAEALGAGLTPRHAAVTTDALEASAEIRDLVAALERAGAEVVATTRTVMVAMSPLTTPGGLVAIVDRPGWTFEHLVAGDAPLVVIAHDVQDPGNLGAIIRAADAAGATGVAASGQSADPFGWKALRGSMGSAFRLPTWRPASVEEAIGAARRAGLAVVATVPRGGTPMFESDLTGALALVLGGEGSGLSDAIVRLADRQVTAPMRRPVESLNVAVAAAVLLYEALRQRRASESGR